MISYLFFSILSFFGCYSYNIENYSTNDLYDDEFCYLDPLFFLFQFVYFILTMLFLILISSEIKSLKKKQNYCIHLLTSEKYISDIDKSDAHSNISIADDSSVDKFLNNAIDKYFDGDEIIDEQMDERIDVKNDLNTSLKINIDRYCSGNTNNDDGRYEDKLDNLASKIKDFESLVKKTN